MRAQVGASVEELKRTISKLKEAAEGAAKRQKEANMECKRLEGDMDDFKNNKEGKITELKVKGTLHLSTQPSHGSI